IPPLKSPAFRESGGGGGGPAFTLEVEEIGFLTVDGRNAVCFATRVMRPDCPNVLGSTVPISPNTGRTARDAAR
mgnify:CR=1